MAIFRQYIAPLLVVLIFALALVAVSARIFLPDDMAAPAPIEPETPVSFLMEDRGLTENRGLMENNSPPALQPIAGRSLAHPTL